MPEKNELATKLRRRRLLAALKVWERSLGESIWWTRPTHGLLTDARDHLRNVDGAPLLPHSAMMSGALREANAFKHAFPAASRTADNTPSTSASNVSSALHPA